MCSVRSTHTFQALNILHQIKSCVTNGLKQQKIWGQNRRQRVPGHQFLVLSRSEVLDRQQQLQQQKFLQTGEVEHVWDISFSWKLFLTVLCCHKINRLRQLRGFIPQVLRYTGSTQNQLYKTDFLVLHCIMHRVSETLRMGSYLTERIFKFLYRVFVVTVNQIFSFSSSIFECLHTSHLTGSIVIIGY